MKRKLPSIKINPVCFVSLSLFAAFDGSVVIAVFAALLHEAGHIIAILLSGRKIKSLTVTLLGAQMELYGGISSYADDVFINLSGPTANAFGIVPYLIFGENAFCESFALCNMALMIFNLMPISGLDGGEALLSILKSRGFYGEKIMRICSFCGIVFLWLCACRTLFFEARDFSLMATCFYLFFYAILKSDKT